MVGIIKKADVIAITSVIIFGVLLGLYFAADNFGFSKRTLIIESDSKIIKQIDMDSVKEKSIVKVENKYGRNDIEISEKGVKVIYSDCRQKIEMKEEYINKPGQTLICLPHKLIIKITGKDKDAPDTVSY